MYKRGYLLPTMKEYWFVLQPTELLYYKGQNEQAQCGAIALDPQCRVDMYPNNNNSRDKLQRLILNTKDRAFELATVDHR